MFKAQSFKIMFKNNFKIAWRNLKAHRLFTLLNIAGLAIGLCICLILFAYVSKELSFDRMYKNAKHIYRVNMQTTEEFNFEKWAKIPNAIGPALVREIPEVKLAARLIKDDFGATASVRVGDKNFAENGLYLADSSLFKIIDFHFIEGTAHSVFIQPNSIVLSQSAKARLFGSEAAIGKIIYVNNRDTLNVSGVYKDLPKSSTIDCAMIYNIMDSWMGKDVSWSNASFETYCLLQPDANIEKVQKQASDLIDKNVSKENKYYTRFLLQPYTKIHLYSSDLKEGYSSRSGSIAQVRTLLLLSLLILLIACINYMNLATARSQKRAKGIGVNKVLGANTRQMLFQLFTETGVLAFIAVVIGYFLSFFLIPFFKNITGVELNSSTLYETPILLSLIIIWLLVTIIAGSYPAISMSRISPLILMNKSKQKHSVADNIRKVLVVFQFASSIILIIAVIIIFQQMEFVRNKNLGYNPKGVLALSIKSAQSKQMINTTIIDLKGLASVEDVSAVQSIPGENESGKSVYKLQTDKTGFPVWTCRTDGSVISTLQLKLLAGNRLPQSLAPDDTTCYTLINEAVANYIGYKSPEEAVGKNIITEMSDHSIIAGVVKNFNFQSLKDQIGGYMYYKMNGAKESTRTLLVRYNTQNLQQLLQQSQLIFKNNLPETAFDYQFLDKHVQDLYTSERHTANAAKAFSFLGIFIASLGLFGLAAFTAEQRTKEIGIRKVMGASVSGIIALLSKDFLKLVILSIIIAAPVAWWVMTMWLQDFAYKINISWWVIGLAGLTAIVIALITVSFQAIKAAMANPVESLRTE